MLFLYMYLTNCEQTAAHDINTHKQPPRVCLARGIERTLSRRVTEFDRACGDWVGHGSMPLQALSNTTPCARVSVFYRCR